MQDTRSFGRLTSKLCYISFLVKYYGYFHECAELFRQLNKASKREWDKNLKSLVDVIMSNEECKLTLIIAEEFDHKIARLLLRNSMYAYFNLDVNFCSKTSYNAGIKFLKNISIYSPKMFISLHADFKSTAKLRMTEFFKLHEKKGLSKDGISIDPSILQVRNEIF
jgi:hypothetical protein